MFPKSFPRPSGQRRKKQGARGACVAHTARHRYPAPRPRVDPLRVLYILCSVFSPAAARASWAGLARARGWVTSLSVSGGSIGRGSTATKFYIIVQFAARLRLQAFLIAAPRIGRGASPLPAPPQNIKNFVQLTATRVLSRPSSLRHSGRSAPRVAACPPSFGRSSGACRPRGRDACAATAPPRSVY